MKRLIIILAICAVYTSAFAQWETVNPYPTLSNLNSVEFIKSNPNIGYAVGGNTVLKTTDKGDTWTRVQVVIDAYDSFLRTVFFNENKGFLISRYKTFKTTDGGNKWVASNYYNNLQFLDGQNIGFAYTNLNNDWLYKSTNSGYTWQKIATNISAAPFLVYFIDENIGFCYYHREALLKKTEDGGKTWKDIQKNFAMDSIARIQSLQFFDKNNGVATSAWGTIYTTSDCGLTWGEQNKRSLSNKATTYFSKNLGCSVGHGGIIRMNYEWQICEGIYTGLPLCFNDVKFIDENTLVTVGDFGTILKSTTRGKTWEQKSKGFYNDLRCHFVLDSTTGLIAGNKGFLIKTTDLGKTWDKIETTNSLDINSMYFIDSRNGFCLTEDSQKKCLLNKTSDGGVSWSYISIMPKSTSYQDFKFTDLNTGFIATDKTILRTNNAGITWDTLFYKNYYSKLQMIDSKIGFVMRSDSNGLMKTTDGGDSWKSINKLNGSYYMFDFNFTSEKCGIVLTYNSAQKTRDGGITWDPIQNVSANAPRTLSFVNDNIGFYVGTNSSTGHYITYNSGGNWTYIPPQNEYYTYYTNSVKHFSFDGSALFNYGYKCVLMKYPLPEVKTPSVSTKDVSYVKMETAISGGVIPSSKILPVTSCGVVWSKDHYPTLNSNEQGHTTDSLRNGEFTSLITKLVPGTKYYIAAYATNLIGTAYGQEIEFTTTTSSVGSTIEPSIILVYPNPTSGELKIVCGASSANSRAVIMDMLGNEVMTAVFPPETAILTKSIDISSLQRGIYILTIDTGTERQTVKIVKI